MAELPKEIAEHLNEIRELCIAHHVKTLTLFGSAARSDFDPDRSDADFLVEFLPSRRVSGFEGDYFRLAADLEGLLGRKVDLVEPQVIRNPYLRKAIYEALVPIYVAA